MNDICFCELKACAEIKWLVFKVLLEDSPLFFKIHGVETGEKRGSLDQQRQGQDGALLQSWMITKLKSLLTSLSLCLFLWYKFGYPCWFQASIMVQFLIENCCRIFGEEITSIFADIVPKNDNREDGSGKKTKERKSCDPSFLPGSRVGVELFWYHLHGGF